MNHLTCKRQRTSLVAVGPRSVACVSAFPTCVPIEVSNVSIVMCTDEDGLRRMTNYSVNTIVGIGRGIVVDQLHGYFACFSIVDHCFQRIVRHDKLMGVLRDPIDGYGNAVI